MLRSRGTGCSVSVGQLFDVQSHIRVHLRPDARAAPSQDGQTILLRAGRSAGWLLRALGAEVALEPSVYLGRTDEVAQTTFVEFGLDRTARRGVPVMQVETKQGPVTVTTGAVVSTTVTVCVHAPAFPQSSVVVQVRVITDSCGQVPAVTASPSVIAGAASQLSVAVATPVPVDVRSSVHSTVASSGQVITGAVVSTTATVCVQELAFPQASVARYVRVMVSGQLRVSEVSPTCTTVIGSGQLSVVVTDDDLAELTVVIADDSISEGAGAAATTLVVTRNTDPTNALVVTLASDDTSEATVPTTITIAAGQSSSGAIPIDCNSLTECCVGFVFNSPEAAR